MPRGGKREGAGRKPGQVPAARRELMEMAKDHADRALAVLVEVMDNNQESGATRANAATAILDRAYGKPRQMIEGSGEGGAIKVEATLSDDLRTALDAIAGKIASGGKPG
jgi:hypothetical protein